MLGPTSFHFDPTLNQLLEDLRVHFCAESKGEILLWAITLLEIVSKNESRDGSIILRHDEQDLKIVLR